MPAEEGPEGCPEAPEEEYWDIIGKSLKKFKRFFFKGSGYENRRMTARIEDDKITDKFKDLRTSLQGKEDSVINKIESFLSS